MKEMFEKVLALDEKINAACAEKDYLLADKFLREQDILMAHIEANGWRQEFDKMITEMN